MDVAILLGVIQGLFEWLPISSEGLVAATYSNLWNRPLDEGIAYALWLHIGTTPAVIVIFWRDLVKAIREFFTHPKNLSRLSSFLAISTILSTLIGFPMLLLVQEISDLLGTGAMALIGLFMFITGCILLTRQNLGTRDRRMLTSTDSLLTGLAQGLAVIPGLSRSGITMAVLLGRNIDRREAVSLSFMISVPASLAAAVYASWDSEIRMNGETFVATLTAFLVGMIAIKGFLTLCEKVNFGLFVILLGFTIAAGSILPFLTRLW